jgi:hypothetical protein
MEKLDIKRGNFEKVEGDNLFKLMKEVFGNCDKADDWCISNYGAMQPIRAKVLSKSEMTIEITTVQIPEDQVLDTMKKRNFFLEEATGFTSKQRLKRLKDKAKKGSL